MALLSGRLAAETAVRALHAGDCSAAGLAEYERRWRQEFPAYRRLIGGRKAIFGLTDQELGDLAALLPSELSSVGLIQRLAMGLRILCRPRLLAKGAFQVLDACDLSRAGRGGW
jgi:flavin-dependent dehydrogenase